VQFNDIRDRLDRIRDDYLDVTPVIVLNGRRYLGNFLFL